jgi:NAD(P)-dependent dehydrogenase (short-subunit alcohol dehydrogenase family)
MTVLLENKNCIVYGAGGSLGGAISRTFAREGANLFLAGRTRAPLEAVAADIPGAEIAELDVLDGRAVDEHARAVAGRAGSVDVSFNLATRGDVQGIPLVEMPAEDFMRPVQNGLLGTFHTATAAARIMSAQGGGAILSLTSGSAKGAHPGMGGTGPADAAVETFLRYLAAETGRQGVRVLGIYTAGVKGTVTKEDIQKVNAGGPDPDDVDRMLSQMAWLGRTPRIPDVAETAAFLASDRASGITASIVNVTCGLFATP